MVQGACRRLFATVTLGAMLIVYQGANGAQAAKNPPEWLGDICPFECCKYGDWVSRSTAPIAVHSGKAANSRVVFRLHQGQRFEALKGEIQVLRPGVMTLSRSITDTERGGKKLSIPRGKRVLLLAYLGEGAFLGWADGQTVGLDFEDGDISSAAIFNWWVNVRDAKGRSGWIRIRVEAKNGTDKIEPTFHGMDGCG